MAIEALKALEGAIVFPGQALSVIEELIPGEGVYVDDKGVIRAARVGRVTIDFVQRRIAVKPLRGRSARLPSRDSIVYGYVHSVPRDDIAIVRIVFNESMEPFSGGFTGILHVSQALAERQQATIYDAVRLGDFVKAVVLNNANPYIISIKKPGLGVIAAYCSRCGAPLYRVPGKNALVCLNCGNVEQRKTSPQYLFVERRARKSH